MKGKKTEEERKQKKIKNDKERIQKMRGKGEQEQDDKETMQRKMERKEQEQKIKSACADVN